MSADRDQQTIATAAAAFAAVAAYFAGPIFKFAPASVQAAVGFLLAVAAACVWLQLLSGPKKSGWSFGFDILVLIVAILGLGYVAVEAKSDADANEIRCQHVQREMLYPEPRREDLPELFQALGCRPQGTDDVQFPKTSPHSKNRAALPSRPAPPTPNLKKSKTGK